MADPYCLKVRTLLLRGLRKSEDREMEISVSVIGREREERGYEREGKVVVCVRGVRLCLCV